MGSNVKFIPITKAAEILGCPAKKVHALADQGLVRRTLEEDNAYVSQEDIAEIHRLNIAGELKPGELVRRLLFAERKLERLEATINLLLEVNGLAASRFVGMNDPDLLSLFQNVEEALGEEQWPTKVMANFCEVFIKITEIEIDRLNEMLNVDHSWETFYRLCLKMTKHVAQSDKLSTDLELQRVRDLLHMGRRNLSTIAVLFVEKAGQIGPSHKLLARLASSDIELFDNLAKQLKGKSKRGHLALV